MNSYFQFKQFKIEQEKSSMKVCTDSCLFGAWIAEKISRKYISPNNMLDIGTGTGVLSLMLAQQINVAIDAVEIDKNAFEQATVNFAASPWHQQLQAIHMDVTKMNKRHAYDLIICNPPFFENDLRSDNHEKNLAKHHEGLTLNDLTKSVNDLLSPEGYFAVLLPFHRSEYFKSMANAQQLFLYEELLIRQTERHSFFRSVLLFGRNKKEILTETMSIKDDQQNYTPRFITLLKDYYLYL